MRRSSLAIFCLLLAGLLDAQISYRVGHSNNARPQISVGQTANSLKTPSAAKPAQSIQNPNLFPTLSGRVVDNAGMLNANELKTLEAQLAAFETKSSDQVVVATIASLNGENLEDYTNRLFRHWKLGQAEENNGVLLLVARNDRKIRIEVGYGLEGTLTDALSKVIIDQVIVPEFKSGNFGEGVIKGADMIIAVLSGDKAELEARKNRNPKSNQKQVDIAVWIFLIIWGTLFFGPLGLALLAPVFGKKIGKHRYRWFGIEIDTSPKNRHSSSGNGYGWSRGSSGGGFSGGGGSSGGGGASGGW